MAYFAYVDSTSDWLKSNEIIFSFSNFLSLNCNWHMKDFSHEILNSFHIFC